MTILEEGLRQRLARLLQIASAERHYLLRSDQRLFHPPPTLESLAELPDQDQLAESVDAFVARFGRYQDTLGDKLLPAFLQATGERPGTVLENLDRAEKLGLLDSADRWMSARRIRNRMIHEYVSDPRELLQALTAAHDFIPLLTRMHQRTEERLRSIFPGQT